MWKGGRHHEKFQFAENAKKGFLNQVFCKGFIIHHPLADGVNAAGVLVDNVAIIPPTPTLT